MKGSSSSISLNKSFQISTCLDKETQMGNSFISWWNSYGKLPIMKSTILLRSWWLSGWTSLPSLSTFRILSSTITSMNLKPKEPLNFSISIPKNGPQEFSLDSSKNMPNQLLSKKIRKIKSSVSIGTLTLDKNFLRFLFTSFQYPQLEKLATSNSNAYMRSSTKSPMKSNNSPNCSKKTFFWSLWLCNEKIKSLHSKIHWSFWTSKLSHQLITRIWNVWLLMFG